MDIDEKDLPNTGFMFADAGTQTGPIPKDSGEAGEWLQIILAEELHSFKRY
jgi:hypothetical protein